MQDNKVIGSWDMNIFSAEEEKSSFSPGKQRLRILLNNTMNRHKCFVISVVLVICALGSEFVSKRYSSRVIKSFATEFVRHDQMPKAEKIQAKVEQEKFVKRGSQLQYLGMGLAALSFVVWVISGYWSRHRLWWYIPLILFVVYVLFAFLIVV